MLWKRNNSFGEIFFGREKPFEKRKKSFRKNNLTEKTLKKKTKTHFSKKKQLTTQNLTSFGTENIPKTNPLEKRKNTFFPKKPIPLRKNIVWTKKTIKNKFCKKKLWKTFLLRKFGIKNFEKKQTNLFAKFLEKNPMQKTLQKKENPLKKTLKKTKLKKNLWKKKPSKKTQKKNKKDLGNSTKQKHQPLRKKTTALKKKNSLITRNITPLT